MKILRFPGLVSTTDKLSFGLYVISYPGFIVLNNLLHWLSKWSYSGKGISVIYVFGEYCSNSELVDVQSSSLKFSVFIGFKLALIPMGWAFYKLLKNEKIKNWLSELLLCFFLFDLVFLVFYPVLLLFDMDLTWYYFSAVPEFYFSFLLGLPDLMVPAIFAILLIYYLIYFKPLSFLQVGWRFLICSISLAVFVALLNTFQVFFFK